MLIRHRELLCFNQKPIKAFSVKGLRKENERSKTLSLVTHHVKIQAKVIYSGSTH